MPLVLAPLLLGKETRPMTITAPPPPALDLDYIGETTCLAVSYLRVSSKEQAERGGRDEGFSIPAQREANLRKARDLDAVIVEEEAVLVGADATDTEVIDDAPTASPPAKKAPKR